MVGNQARRSFHVGASVRQGDALSATLFNLALHRAIQDIQIQGTVVNRMIQLFGYADNIAVVRCSTVAIRELFQVLEREGSILGSTNK
jgi:hypothetical protein